MKYILNLKKWAWENYSDIEPTDIDNLYQSLLDNRSEHTWSIRDKTWGQRGICYLTQDNNLLTFGQNI
jgi:hypothetical protein